MPNALPSVLVIEDNDDFRDVVTKMLYGHTCYAAATQKEGLALYKKHIPDVVFLDITLPDGNGLEMLPRIKAINPDAYVVMLTQSNVRDDVVQAVRNGVASYVLKPLTRKHIKQCLENYRNKEAEKQKA